MVHLGHPHDENSDLQARWSREPSPLILAQGHGFEVWRTGINHDIAGILRDGQLLVVDAIRDCFRGQDNTGIGTGDVILGNNVVAIVYGTHYDLCTLYGFWPRSDGVVGMKWQVQSCDYPCIDGHLWVKMNGDEADFNHGKKSPPDVYRNVRFTNGQFTKSYCYMLGAGDACDKPVTYPPLPVGQDRFGAPRLIDQRI
jgi:hypothetical protein